MKHKRFSILAFLRLIAFSLSLTEIATWGKCTTLCRELNLIRRSVKLWKWGHADKVKKKVNFHFLQCLIANSRNENKNIAVGLGQSDISERVSQTEGGKKWAVEDVISFCRCQDNPPKMQTQRHQEGRRQRKLVVQNICKSFHSFALNINSHDFCLVVKLTYISYFSLRFSFSINTSRPGKKEEQSHCVEFQSYFQAET